MNRDPHEAWNEAEAINHRARFEQLIYGDMPVIPNVRCLALEALPTGHLGETAIAERWQFEIETGSDPLAGALLLVLPRARSVQAMMVCQAFQRPPSPLARVERVIANGEKSGRVRASDAALELILGEHIHVPPLAHILRAGFGLCLFCPGELVPDNRRTAPAILDRLAKDGQRSGALAWWAAITSAVRRLLAGDQRLCDTPMVAWGHSRHGKAALLAGAFDPDFAAVISHQSGRFGAALTHGGSGEGILQIARAYPHWFKGGFAESAQSLPHDLDQHLLLGLIAPRPVLLGNADADFWADPRGTFKAAQAAHASFARLKAPGFLQATLGDPNCEGGLVAFSRKGGHGIRSVDWAHFLQFMRVKFGGVEYPVHTD